MFEFENKRVEAYDIDGHHIVGTVKSIIKTEFGDHVYGIKTDSGAYRTVHLDQIESIDGKPLDFFIGN